MSERQEPPPDPSLVRPHEMPVWPAEAAPPAADVPLRPYEVEVRTLARTDRVPGIRALAADLAMRADHDLDAIDDLRLAVEEACATMLTNADRDRVLVCRLLITEARFEVNAFVALTGEWQPTVGRLSLRILRTLSDTVDYWTSGTDGYRLFHVQLTKSYR